MGVVVCTQRPARATRGPRVSDCQRVQQGQLATSRFGASVAIDVNAATVRVSGNVGFQPSTGWGLSSSANGARRCQQQCHAVVWTHNVHRGFVRSKVYIWQLRCSLLHFFSGHHWRHGTGSTKRGAKGRHAHGPHARVCVKQIRHGRIGMVFSCRRLVLRSERGHPTGLSNCQGGCKQSPCHHWVQRRVSGSVLQTTPSAVGGRVSGH